VSGVGTAPAGTVTFVFTDIEGSTRLLEEIGAERYAALLAEHHRVCRDAWGEHDGFEVDTGGDSFFVAFSRAADALAAAAAAQSTLEPLGLRVRIGVHTGDVLLADAGYVGMEVHRAARIAAAAHGGQIVVSAATAAVTDVRLRDLGDHRFKDLRAPERVFQLGEGTFPPLRSLYRSNLPVPATSFLGRTDELAEVLELLGRGEVRLVTLTGPGGTGKTRLALQAAADASDGYPGGLCWVPLAPLRDPEHALDAVARAFELDDPTAGSLLEALALRIANRPTLLILDNAEHLLPRFAGIVTELTAACGSLTVLVTSRERLQLAAEHVYPVPALEQRDAADLFVARARQFDARFEDSRGVPELCRLLDDLPLALELAAARTTVFTPKQLIERIGGRLDLLRAGRDADPRQQTLRATIDWSHDLLDERERRLFRRLSVFPAGCSYETADGVAGADPDALQSLLDKSLVRRRETNFEARYWMLETIREYAQERLEEAGEHNATVDRMVDAYLAFAEDAEPGWHRGDSDRWVSRFVAELPNIRATLAWSLEHRPADALAITAYLGYCWQLAGLFPEMLEWMGRSRERSGSIDDDLVAYVTMVDGLARLELGLAGAEELLRACLPLLQAAGRPHHHAFLLTFVASYEATKDLPAAEALLHEAEREALELESDNQVLLGAALEGLADLAAKRGDDDEALALYERAAELVVVHPAHQVSALVAVAEHLLGRPAPELAQPWLRRAEAIIDEFPELVARERPWVDLATASTALLLRDIDEAQRRVTRTREAAEATGRLPLLAQALILQAGVHALRGELAAARDARHRAAELPGDRSPSVRTVERLFLCQ
jgi:predicted ATPase/class 3 adenylate cyclase